MWSSLVREHLPLAGSSAGLRMGEQNDHPSPPSIHSIKQRERRFGWCAAQGAVVALNLCRGMKHDAVMSAGRGRCCKQAARRPSRGSVNFCREARLELEDGGRCSVGVAGRGRRQLEYLLTCKPRTQFPRN